MGQVILLGTGAAWSGADRENTFLLVRGKSVNILIDCAGSPAQRLEKVGIKPNEIDHVILTHNHPDHIYGFPMLILNAWMAGRREPMTIYGLESTLESARKLLNALEFDSLPDLMPLQFEPLSLKSNTVPLRIAEFDILGAPTSHFVPTLALRFTDRNTGNTIAYSSDTAPDANVVALAQDADVFLHEATLLDTSSAGHSNAYEAGVDAAAANVQELVLLHVPPNVNPAQWREAANANFPGKVTVARDFDVIDF